MDDNPRSGPSGGLSIRTVAMPADTNPRGDIFGGWLLAQMDIAGGIAASARADGRCATVAVETMKFHQPVHIGDVLSVYAEVVRIGRTSLACHIEAWVARLGQGQPILGSCPVEWCSWRLLSALFGGAGPISVPRRVG
ncbi:MAG: acyl-CoA thioesterase [Alphaproteobacteria bacterium]|nr:acyl-CoA thioesterase [Alphaproteobacteria bacterium]